MAAYAERRFAEVTHNETIDTRTREVDYVILEASSVDEARDVLIRDSSRSEGALVRSSIRGLRRINDTSYEGTVVYSPETGLSDPDLSEIPGREASITFNTVSGTARTLVSIYTPEGYLKDTAAPGSPRPDSHGFINATADGVEGVDISRSNSSITITKSFLPFELPPSYMDTLDAAQDTVNSMPVVISALGIVRTYAPGELLFKGWSGGMSTTDGRWRFSYEFLVSKNKFGVIVPGLEAFTKFGWDYLEVRTEQAYEQAAEGKVRVRKPIAAFSHQVYLQFDHNTLGI